MDALPFQILWGLLIPFSAGYATLSYLLRKTPAALSFKAALAFLLGIGLLTQWMLLLHVLGLRWTLAGITLPLAIGSLIMITAGRIQRKDRTPQSRCFTAHPPADTSPAGTRDISILKITEILIILFIALNFMDILWRSVNIPVYGYDAVRISSLKAKMFFYDRAVSFRGNPAFHGYPLLVPLSQTWMALNLGQWDDQWVKIFCPFFFLSYITIHYHFVKQQTGRTTALLGLYLLLASPLFNFHATMPYMDFPLMTFTCSTVILLLMWHHAKDEAFVILAGLLAGGAAFSKREGIVFLLIYPVLLFLPFNGDGQNLKKKLMILVKFIIPGLMVLVVSRLCMFLAKARVIEDTHFQLTGQAFGRPPVILGQFLKELLLSGNWNILWFLLGMSLLFHRKKITKEKNILLLTAAVTLFLGVYFITFLTTTAFRWIDHNDVVLSRLFLHFYPLAPLLIVLLLSKQRKINP